MTTLDEKLLLTTRITEINRPRTTNPAFVGVIAICTYVVSFLRKFEVEECLVLVCVGGGGGILFDFGRFREDSGVGT
jgi:hypothetical protein